jgi:hypothetical protein
MNLFRSEGHARAWQGFRPEAEQGLLPLKTLLAIFSSAYFKERGNGRYISSFARLRPEFLETLRSLTHDLPFWRPASG